MTQSRILVSLTAGYMSINVLQPTRTTGTRSAWQRWRAYLQGQATPDERVVHSITVQGNTSMQGLAILFQKGLDALKLSQLPALVGSPIEVVLGPSLSHVGVLEVVADGAQKLSEAEKASFVDAWISQAWAVPPSECVVCCVPINRSGRHLVTGIERYIVNTIDTLCAQESLQLRSCKPALANHLATLVNDNSTRAPSPMAGNGSTQDINFGVFVELGINDRRTNIVQFLVFMGSEPLSVIRMWLPVVEGVNEDSEVKSVLQRLQAQYQHASAPQVDWVRWPLGVVGAAKP